MNYEELIKQITHHNELYYKLAKPEISDEAYDVLYDTLLAMEEQQGFAHPNSPSQKVGYRQGKRQLLHRVYSLKKVYDESEVPAEFTIKTRKLDGVSLSVFYSGRIYAVTRGDGEFGEDVTHLVQHIKDIPEYILEAEGIQVVGEVLTDNLEVENKRNYVAGALNSKTADQIADKALCFVVHDVLGIEENYTTRLNVAKSLGFDTVLHKSVEQYPSDGLVYRTDSRSRELELGHTSKHPRFAVALKQKSTFIAETIIQDIFWSVGRTGVVTPVCIVTPVVLDDAQCSKLTLHNFQFVLDNNLGKGDKILIERQITPQFVAVVEHSKYERFTKLDAERQLETPCEQRGPRLYTTGDYGSRAVEHFVKTLEIKHLGPQTIKKHGFTHPLDIFDYHGWEQDGAMGQKIAWELKQPKQYAKVLAALGIPGVGKATAQDIVNAIPNFSDLHKIRSVEIKGVGPLTKDKIEGWLEENEDWVLMLPENLSLEHEVQKIDNPIRVCITGKLDRTRDELTREISLFGVQVLSTVTKQCNALIYGDQTSSKYKKASAQGTLLIDYWKHRESILSGEIFKTIERTP